MTARIERSAVRVLPIFDIIAKKGDIPERDMFNTFNMGVGMAAVADPCREAAAIAALASVGISAYKMGEVVRGDEGVVIC